MFSGVLVIDGGADIAVARAAEEFVFSSEMGGDVDEVEIVIRVRDEWVTSGDFVKGKRVFLDGRELRIEAWELRAGDVAWWMGLRGL